ncbi:hypothetical protein N7474_009759 [Penicillium riverlandense]|uniref:uncharacterized protein n=1 Tax=Penicillium riverlandense TaxID=1903569 RepID=UPI0025498986|nr:uncharacterized protein N7474_009759 [Penicillium riverlandense]KAJ5808490.1 hypothetical protein N7474_009759 [Penicillium riverlandense]
MFVYRLCDLPADPVFPADLEKLGYFVTENDQIRMISNPEENFLYKINRNERWNELQKEAMNECIRRIVLDRLHKLGLETWRLPLSASPQEAHVPILVSNNLPTASRIVVIFGEPSQDLGIWAYRTVGVDSIHAGSAVGLARAALNKDTALVLANTGQLIWHCSSGRAVTQPTWLSLPRSSACAGQPTMSYRNKIPGNTDWPEHVSYVFDNVLAPRVWCNGTAPRIDVIGVSEGGLAAFQYLKANWVKWRTPISAMSLTEPLHSSYDLEEDDLTNPTSFAAFVSSRCRGYVLSDKPVGDRVAGYREHGCNCYSSGEALNVECIMPVAWRHMLDWLDLTHANRNYAEQVMILASDINDATRERLEELDALEEEVDHVLEAEVLLEERNVELGAPVLGLDEMEALDLDA